jgi:hypothetical protein
LVLQFDNKLSVPPLFVFCQRKHSSILPVMQHQESNPKSVKMIS